MEPKGPLMPVFLMTLSDRGFICKSFWASVPSQAPQMLEQTTAFHQLLSFVLLPALSLFSLATGPYSLIRSCPNTCWDSQLRLCPILNSAPLCSFQHLDSPANREASLLMLSTEGTAVTLGGTLESSSSLRYQ